jgi:hypothetical protein
MEYDHIYVIPPFPPGESSPKNEKKVRTSIYRSSDIVPIIVIAYFELISGPIEKFSLIVGMVPEIFIPILKLPF